METAVHRAHPLGRQAKLFFQIKGSAFSSQFNGLRSRGQTLKMVVTVRRFDHKLYMLINLLLLNFRTDGLNHIASGQDFIQNSFAENFVPASGAAGSNTANHNVFMIVGRLFGFCRANFGFCRSFRFFGYYGSRWIDPFGKSGVIGRIVTIHIRTGPVNGNAGGNQIGKQIVKFHNTAFFGVVGSQNANVFFVRQCIGG